MMWWQAWQFGRAMNERPPGTLICPCCKGDKRLTVIEHDEESGRTVVTKPVCNHCMGRGWVPTR